MKTLFKINIWTYFYALLLIGMGYINYLIILIFIFFIHEIGHIIFLKIFNYRIENICIYPCGGMIKTNIQINIPSHQLFLISVGGILSQIILLFWTNNWLGYNSLILKRLNILILLFNLLPIYPLDGYKILLSLLEGLSKYRIIIQISYIISLISMALFFIISENVIMFIFLALMNMLFIKNHKYYYNKFLLERYLYDYDHSKNYYIGSINDFKKNKNNYIKTERGYIEEKAFLKSFFQQWH